MDGQIWRDNGGKSRGIEGKEVEWMEKYGVIIGNIVVEWMEKRYIDDGRRICRK